MPPSTKLSLSQHERKQVGCIQLRDSPLQSQLHAFRDGSDAQYVHAHGAGEYACSVPLLLAT